MKNSTILLSVIFIISAFLLSFKLAEPKKVLTISIVNLSDNKNPIVIGVYNKAEDFPNKAVYKKYLVTPGPNKTAVLHITDLSYGDYAVSMFQDKNKDMKLNTNFVGIPIEPYAFSNNFKPKFTAPEYKQCVFSYDEQFHSMSIEMIH